MWLTEELQAGEFPGIFPWPQMEARMGRSVALSRPSPNPVRLEMAHVVWLDGKRVGEVSAELAVDLRNTGHDEHTVLFFYEKLIRELL